MVSSPGFGWSCRCAVLDIDSHKPDPSLIYVRQCAIPPPAVIIASRLPLSPSSSASCLSARFCRHRSIRFTGRPSDFPLVTLTLIYATYVLGNLAALLLFGRLADQIRRRAASLPAIAIGIASAAVFAAAENTAWLFAARAVSG